MFPILTSQLTNQRNKMRRKISISSTNSSTYLFNSLKRQFKKALDKYSIGEMLNSKQLLNLLSFMGFTEEEPSEQQVQLSKTLANMLSEPGRRNSVRRSNIFKFLAILCGVEEKIDTNYNSCFEQQIIGLALQEDEYDQPLIIIKLGIFEENGKWVCDQIQAKSLRQIFKSLRLKRMSRQQIESRKRTSRSKDKQKEKQTMFKPQICLKSSKIVERKNKKLQLNASRTQSRVQNRLLISRDQFRSKIEQQLNRSIEKQMKQCTFAPKINQSRKRTSSSLNKSRCFSQQHLKDLLNKGNTYKNKKEELQSLQIKLNESIQLKNCTFKPQTTKHTNLSHTKWVSVKNRQKQIQRLRLGQQKREFMGKVKERGYPAGVNWSQYVNQSKATIGHNKQNMSESINKKNSKEGFSFIEGKSGEIKRREPILCIDLKIMEMKQNLNVWQGDDITSIAEQISRQNNIHESMWWRVQDLVHKAVGECGDVRIKNNRIYSVWAN